MSSHPKIQTFRPTIADFRNMTFGEYIQHIEEKGAHLAGVAKIVPPPEWIPRKKDYESINSYNLKDFRIVKPQYQVVTGADGFYQLAVFEKYTNMKLKDFIELSNHKEYKTPVHSSQDELENIFWENIKSSVPLYGAGLSGSFMDEANNIWNLNRLGTILDYVKEDYGIELGGINTTYLYFGMWKTAFAWHTEDMDLYSINYLHFGAPKTWYAVPPQYGRKLEELASRQFEASYRVCASFLRHKLTLIRPDILKQYNIPFDKVTQNENEILITFPFGYHAGFNNGLNCAESLNFATPRWVEYGKRADQCVCKDSLAISMDTFVKRFQPHQYDSWLKGEDFGYHPEDINKKNIKPTPLPSVLDVLLNKNNSEVPKHILRRLLKTHTEDLPKMPYKLQHPDIDFDEIKARKDLPKDVKKSFQAI